MNQKKAGQSLAAFAKQLGTPENAKTDFGKPEISEDEHPHGDRGDFIKVTVTLPPDVYEALVNESARRKIARAPNRLVAGIVREAVTAYLRKN